MPPVAPHAPTPPDSENSDRHVSAPKSEDVSIVNSSVYTLFPALETTEQSTKNISPLLYKPMLIVSLLSLLVTLLARAAPSTSNGGLALPTIVSIAAGFLVLVVAVYSLARQWRLFAKSRQLLFWLEIILAVGSLLLVPLAAVFGDMAGGSRYSTPSQLSLESIGYMALASLGSITVLVAFGNALYISTGFHKAVKVLGYIAITLCWLALAAASYFAYAVIYSLRDPSTE